MRYVPLGRQWTRRFEEGRDQKKKSEKQQVGGGVYLSGRLFGGEAEGRRREKEGWREANQWVVQVATE